MIIKYILMETIRIYTVILTFEVFALIIKQTELLKGIIAVLLFIVLIVCSIEQYEIRNRGII